MGWSQWPVPFRETWDTYQDWYNYSTHLRDVLRTYSEVTSKLVLMTPHSQCEQKFSKKWADVHSNKSRAIERCASELKAAYSTTSAAAYSDCALGLRGREASAYLASIVIDVVGAHRTKHANCHVALVDGFSFTDKRCNMNIEGDSMHFHKLLYDEIALFMESIDW